MTRQRKIIVSAIAAVLLILGAFLIFLSSVNPSWSPLPALRGDGKGTTNSERETKEAEARLFGALSLVPSNAVMVSHANLSVVDGGNAWWDNYTKMLSPLYVLPEDLPEDLGITSITLASFPNANEEYLGITPLSQEIVLTAPLDKGEAVREYIGSSKDAYTFVHYKETEDLAYIIITDIPAFEPIDKLINGDTDLALDTFESVEEANDFTVNNSSPTMYVDASKYFDVMSAYKPEESEFTKTLLSKGLGLKESTKWLGESKDQGANWNGKFISGGIDKDAINPEQFTQTLNDQIELTPSESGSTSSDTSDTSFDYGYVTYGMSTVAESISISKGDVVAGSIVNPHDMGAEGVTAPLSEDGIITLVFSPQMFQSSYQGSIEPFSIHTITVVLDGDKVSMAFDFYEEADFTEAAPE
jgi:hypothetical protein